MTEDAQGVRNRLDHPVVDIDGDDVLTRDFGVRVPVVLGPGDVVLAEGVIEPRSLRRTLRRIKGV